MSAELWIALAGVIVALLGVSLPVWQSLRKERTEREAERERLVEERIRDAARVERDACRATERERDYLRRRVDELEDELRRGGRRD